MAVTNHHFYQELLRIQLEIQEHSLNMIVKEIYENVGQVLSLVKLNLSTLHTVREKEVHKTATHAGHLLGKAIRDLRKISKPVTSKLIMEKGLIYAMRQELDILSRINNYNTSLIVSEKIARFGAEKELVVFRIVQESINIITDYSTNKTIAIRANSQERGIAFIISNGLEEDSSQIIPKISLTSFGEKCKQMHANADLVNACITISGHPYANLEIKLHVPLTDN